ncbi:ty3-gypsy retrotransposon protein [Tanacetum coccineum]
MPPKRDPPPIEEALASIAEALHKINTTTTKVTETQDIIMKQLTLCFRCPERYHPGHKCNPPQFLLIVDNDDNPDPHLTENTISNLNLPDSEHTTSTHLMFADNDPHNTITAPQYLSLSPTAFLGLASPKALRITAYIIGHPVTVLIDSGNTYNIIQPHIASFLKLPIIPIPSFPVMVGNGNHIYCDGFCQTVVINLQDTSFTIPFFVLPIEGANVVLDMLKDSLIKTSHSPYSSPVLLVRKKDGTWRFCVDYRALNAINIRDRFLIPTVDELLDELHGAHIFSKIDLQAGYHQICLADGDTHKTAFRTVDGHFEFLVMPFGLSNAPSTFQAAMNDIFRDILRRFVLVFSDDILIYSPSREQHYQHLHHVFATLAQHRYYTKSSKCTFGVTEVQYLGHVISESGVATDS